MWYFMRTMQRQKEGKMTNFRLIEMFCCLLVGGAVDAIGIFLFSSHCKRYVIQSIAIQFLKACSARTYMLNTQTEKNGIHCL